MHSDLEKRIVGGWDAEETFASHNPSLKEPREARNHHLRRFLARPD